MEKKQFVTVDTIWRRSVPIPIGSVVEMAYTEYKYLLPFMKQQLPLPGSPSGPGSGTGTTPVKLDPNDFGFFASLNLSGMEGGGNSYPGIEGTNFFAASADDLSYVKARTTGPARFPFLWERIQPQLNGQLDETYLALIKGVVDAARAQGTKVILDCHNYMRRPVFSQTASAPYTIASWNGVDNPDGVVTRAHLVDMWSKIATVFKGDAGVAGYDLMNEPTSDNHFGSSSSSADLATIMQALVDAIVAIDTSVPIFVEGNAYSSCKNWRNNNPSYPLNDPHKQIVYSAHCYPDFDHSGTHFGYDESANASSGDRLTATTFVDLSKDFADWCSSNGVKGHIGEANVGVDDTRWLAVLDNGLTFWKSRGIGVNLWLFGRSFGNNPYNLYPYGGAGTQPPQWKAVQKAVGVGVNVLNLSGPRNGAAGQESLPIQVSCLGYLASDTVVTLSDGGAGGTFTPATVTLQGGIGASVVQTVTYKQPGTKVVTISATAPGIAKASFSFTTDPANPVLSYIMASPKFSDWSVSNGGLTINSPFAADVEGGRTSARLSDNGATAQHIFNGPPIDILPGEAFEDQRVIMGSGVQFSRIYVSGDSGASFGIDFDGRNGVIVSGVASNGGTLIDATVTPMSNGFYAVRVKGILGATDSSARQWIALSGAVAGQTVYAGEGADTYIDSTAAVPTTIYVGPIHAFGGVPINTAAPSSAYTSGTGEVGSVIAVGKGSWTGSPSTFTYGWLRDGVAISGQSGSSYTTTSEDQGKTITPTVKAKNGAGEGRTVKAQGFAVGATAYVPKGDNLIATQVLSDARWSKLNNVTVTPNYGIAPDGTQTASRLLIQGDFTNALEYDLSHGAAGFQSLMVRTNPSTGDGNTYLCLRSAGADHDFNIDNSGGLSGHPTGTWFQATAPVDANEGFRMQGRGGTIDVLVWGLKVNEGSEATSF